MFKGGARFPSEEQIKNKGNNNQLNIKDYGYNNDKVSEYGWNL